MIAFDFIYCRPYSLKEAVDAYAELHKEGKKTIYYSGGSEIITMCRRGDIRPEAVIDIKNIPECKLLSLDNQELHIGSACTLKQISQSDLFPLLRLACGRIADHSNQCRITLGGNLCGSIIYRETSLPLLLADAGVTLCGPEGERSTSLQSVFNERMRLGPGEMIVQLHIPAWALSARYAHIKKTANEKIDYPLISIAALWKNDYMRIAFSGVCSYPFRSKNIESVLNSGLGNCGERADKALGILPEAIIDDAKASGDYRLFVLKNTLQKLLEDEENATI